VKTIKAHAISTVSLSCKENQERGRLYLPVGAAQAVAVGDACEGELLHLPHVDARAAQRLIKAPYAPPVGGAPARHAFLGRRAHCSSMHSPFHNMQALDHSAQTYRKHRALVAATEGVLGARKEVHGGLGLQCITPWAASTASALPLLCPNG
jgi:hypothetical protein